MDVPERLPRGEWVAASSWGPPCRIEVAWRIGDAGAAAFHETVRVDLGGVFPLDGEIAEVDQCQDMTPRGGGGMFPPMGILGIDPLSKVWAKPASDNVVVPVGGEASIDGIVARVAIEPHDAERPDAAELSVGNASWQLVTVHPALHAGDTFRWGTHDATIVRIVTPDAHFIGWVEVAI
jgi:hypothetical protein